MYICSDMAIIRNSPKEINYEDQTLDRDIVISSVILVLNNAYFGTELCRYYASNMLESNTSKYAFDASFYAGIFRQEFIGSKVKYWTDTKKYILPVRVVR